MFMRYASPNERRTISREDLGFYNALLIGAVYELPSEKLDLHSMQTYAAPLKQCILEQPYLTVYVQGKNTEKSAFYGASSLNLEHHISIITRDELDENKAIERIMQPILDREWPDNIPPWRIVVLPLPPSEDSRSQRCFIAFSFSHTIGDGICGMNFHDRFLKAWRQDSTNQEESLILPLSARTLPDPFDTPSRLPISWSYLLGPLIAVLLPKFLSNLLNLHATTSTISPGTWTGTSMFYDKSTFTSSSRTRLIEIPAPVVQNALQVSRAHNAKLTATIHQLIVRALSKALPDPNITNFVSGTAIDMRGSVGIPKSTWGLHVSGYHDIHTRPSETDLEKPGLSAEEWKVASSMTKSLAETATRLQDQAIGLLRYAPSIRKWTADKIGAQRDCSYRVSNLLAYKGGDNDGWRISKMVFVTPADAVGAPINFDIVSVKGGSLVVGVNWQAGALGVEGGEEGEGRVVGVVCEEIKKGFEGLMT
ncbi:hypothetical protein BJY04DRAFT_232210 [Aspergillus karnatakaensis]|uniref:uncharacterized protein n=1 Tax=Aspergillus karnatakaensis TaxID=1810916 RepID=UPI003CCD1376